MGVQLRMKKANDAGTNDAGTDGSVPILLSKRCNNWGQFRLSPHFSLARVPGFRVVAFTIIAIYSHPELQRHLRRPI
jgi:hypothetical protein